MYGKVLRIIYRIEINSIISSVRKGFTLLIPALLVGLLPCFSEVFRCLRFRRLLRNGQGVSCIRY